MKVIRKYASIIMIITCVVLIAMVFIQYFGRRKIEKEISGIINHDVYKLIDIIVSSYNITEEILATDKITKEQVEILNYYSLDFNFYSIYPRDVASRISNYSNSDLNIFNATKSINVFLETLESKYDKNGVLKGNDILVNLDSNLRSKITVINSLYWEWLCAINLNYPKGVIIPKGELYKISTEFEYYEEYYNDNTIKSK